MKAEARIAPEPKKASALDPEIFERDRPGADQEYRISLPVFEGPLDLLLHLIQKHELDILDIPISFITSKYLEYLDLMENLSIDIASEYLVMAATLAHIKSRMLLPEDPSGQDDDLDLDGLDPREELVRRLLEYQKYKNAAEELGDRNTLGRDIFLRGLQPEQAKDDGPPPLADMGIFELLDAFSKVLSRTKLTTEHEIDFDRMSITERIQQLGDILAEKPRCTFDELFEGARTRFELIMTFLALLEMCKLRMTRIYQADPLSEIHVELAATEPVGKIAPTSDGSLGEPEAE